MGGEVLAMAPGTRQRLMMAAGVPIFHPLVRQTGQQRGIDSRSSSTHHGETEPARPSSPEATAGTGQKTSFVLGKGVNRHSSLVNREDTAEGRRHSSIVLGKSVNRHEERAA